MKNDAHTLPHFDAQRKIYSIHKISFQDGVIVRENLSK